MNERRVGKIIVGFGGIISMRLRYWPNFMFLSFFSQKGGYHTFKCSCCWFLLLIINGYYILLVLMVVIMNYTVLPLILCNLAGLIKALFGYDISGAKRVFSYSN